MSIKEKLVSGAIWNTISQAGTQAFNFVLTIILARLLLPSDFGLLGQVSVMIAFLAYFTEFGITPSLIQKNNPDKTDCDTAYYMMFFFSIVIYFVVFFIAPLIGSFYGNEKLILITRIVFIQFLIMPFAFVHAALETKKLDYKNIVIADLVSLFLSGIIGVILAFKGFGVWSLVWRGLLGSAFRTVVIVYLTTWKPGISFSMKCAIDYYKSGRHFTFRNITLYFSENTDFLIIGKLLGPSALGIYTLAFRLSNYPFTQLQKIFGRMLFPAFQMYKNDRSKMKDIYLKLNVYGMVFLVPLLIAIYIGIDQIINFLLGAKWSGAIPIVKVLVIYLFFTSLSFGDDTMLITLNRIRSVNFLKTFTSLLTFSLGYFATLKYGAIGMATVFTIFAITYILLIKILVMNLLELTVFKYIQFLKEPIILTLSYVLIFTIYKYFTQSISSFLFLAGEGCLFIAVMVSFLSWKGFIDLKKRRINFEVL